MSDSAIDYTKLLDKKYEGLRGNKLLSAPVSALSGVSADGCGALKRALRISTIEQLATNKFVLAAQAIHAAATPKPGHLAALAPVIDRGPVWLMLPDVAQYKGVDWANEIARRTGMTESTAKAFAASNPGVTYFFLTKSSMFLEGGDTWTEKGSFSPGDAVFFSGKPQYGSAPGMADAYELAEQPLTWAKHPDVAQYKGGDWANEVARQAGMTEESAKAFAAANPNVSFFFLVKRSMLLEGGATWTEKGSFSPGDAVFFSGQPWYGSTPGMADSFEKYRASRTDSSMISRNLGVTQQTLAREVALAS